nr:transposase [Pseudomonas fragi]
MINGYLGDRGLSLRQRHHRRCHADSCAQFDQEQGRQTRTLRCIKPRKVTSITSVPKLTLGVDDESGLVHSVVVTCGQRRGHNPSRQTATPVLRNVVCADARHLYRCREARRACGTPTSSGRLQPGAVPTKKHGKRSALYKAMRKIEKAKAQVRAKVEHPFRVIKRQFGYTKVRFRGLVKNTAQMVTLFALSNLWMARRYLLSSAGEVRP